MTLTLVLSSTGRTGRLDPNLNLNKTFEPSHLGVVAPYRLNEMRWNAFVLLMIQGSCCTSFMFMPSACHMPVHASTMMVRYHVVVRYYLCMLRSLLKYSGM
jgi:hypothetical protein